MRRLICALLCSIFLTASVITAKAEEQRAVLTLRVNTVSKQEVTVILRDNDVLIKRSDLEEAGVRGLNLKSASKPSDLISLSSLAPELSFHVDDVALVLDLTVRTNHLESTTVDFRPRQDVSLAKPVHSAFLNYSVSSSNVTGAAFAGEFGTHIGAGTFTSTVSVAGNRQYNSNITRWIVDSPSADRRLTVGDVITYTGDLGGSVSLAGFGVQRYFGFNPDVVKTALPQVTGNALTPSTADVYINGTLYRHVVLPPGQFNFQNLPITQGPNNTTIVVTDAFGRQQTYSNYFYGADTLLAKGLTDFSYSFGVLHSQFGEQVGHGAAAAARYSVGITNNVTGGGRLELSPSIFSGGPAFSFRLAHGVLGTALAVSHSGTQNGDAALFSYQYVDPQISGGLALTFQSPHYSTLALQPYQDRNVLNAQFSIAKQFARGRGISISYFRQNDRDTGTQGVWQVSQVAQLSDAVQLQLGESLTSGTTGRRFGVQTSLSFIPRHGLAASLNMNQSGGQTQTTLQVQKALDSGTPAYGYTISASAGSGSVSEYAAAEYRGQYGDYIANVGTGAGESALSLTAAGALVFIDGHFFPTQSINDSYALVDTGGLAHVRVLANNIVVGRTNKHGYLLVPELGSYLNNEVSIASSDTPIDYTIEDQQQNVAPLYRSGAIVHFGVNRVRPVTGTLLVRLGAQNIVPAFGIIEVDNGTLTVSSDIGEGGEFYFDRLSTGVHHARIRFDGGQCTFNLAVPQSNSHFIKLGTVICQNGVRS